MIAVGVASPSAHGQAITRTEIVIEREKIQDSCPKKYQARPEMTANPITIGTKTAETRSANCAIGAFEPCASSTKRIIWDNVVSAPTFVASIWKAPC